MQEERISKITFLSFVCCIMVVYIHSDNTMQYLIDTSTLLGKVTDFIETTALNTVTGVAVPFFYLLSGMLFFRDYEWNKVFDKYFSRMKSVLLPYLIWNSGYVLVVLACSCFPFLGEQVSDSWKLQPITFKGIIDGLIFYKYNPIYWFMFQLILYIVLSPVLFAFIKNRLVGIIAILLLWMTTMYNGSFSIIQIRGLLFFLIGGFLGRHFWTFMTRSSSKRNSVSAILIFLILQIVFHLLNGILPQKIESLVSSLSILVYLFVIYFGVDLCAKIKEKPYMKYTFFIYSSHLMIISVYKKIFRILLPSSGIFALLTFLLVPIITIVTSIIIATVMNKYTPKIFCVINGGRKVPCK